MKTNNKQSYDNNSWLNEAEKKQERKKVKELRNMKRSKRYQWMEGV